MSTNHKLIISVHKQFNMFIMRVGFSNLNGEEKLKLKKAFYAGYGECMIEYINKLLNVNKDFEKVNKEINEFWNPKEKE